MCLQCLIIANGENIDVPIQFMEKAKDEMRKMLMSGIKHEDTLKYILQQPNYNLQEKLFMAMTLGFNIGIMHEKIDSDKIIHITCDENILPNLQKLEFIDAHGQEDDKNGAN